MRMRSLLAVAMGAILAPAVAMATCGAPQVCADVSTSFAGQILSDGIRVTWSTNSENSGVASYKIRRYNCGTPSTCSVDVTTVTPTGTCTQTENYGYDDSPPTPLSQWTYTLEVWKYGGGRQCAVDTVPQ